LANISKEIAWQEVAVPISKLDSGGGADLLTKNFIAWS